ncbi:DUF4175 family protein [Asticcacaulis tiandongensis]|uniref:DUF4175 family protein n=1 Tax=Asticcacaulis tiandongensis TaxID=2565365 RepID=UPI001128ADA4|nr:DUF4175 family protein [Asticcacaulis tiandongensis]
MRLSRLKRAFALTGTIMVWERVLPALTPFVLWGVSILVAGQWGLWSHLAFEGHATVMVAGLLMALVVSVRFLRRFRRPSFTETNQRLALDNRLRPERLLAMRHETQQPRLRTGKAKAGLAAGDPMALRYVLLLIAAFGLWTQGPVSVSQALSGFMIIDKAPPELRF